MTKSYIPAANAPIRIDVQEGHNQVATVSRQHVKRDRPIGSKDKSPRKTKKGAKNETEVDKIPNMVAADPARDVAAPDPLVLDIAGTDAINVAGPDVPNNVAWDAKRLMDVVTAYLYGPLDNKIYMKVP